MIRRLLLLACLAAGTQLAADNHHKMNRWLRHQVERAVADTAPTPAGARAAGRRVAVRPSKNIFFLAETTDGTATLLRHGCTVCDSMPSAPPASAFAVRAPLAALGPLADEPAIVRMEAMPMPSLQLDTTAIVVGADRVHQGAAAGLPQAFTGRDVMVGIVDVGFDFTHPMFRHADGSSRFGWFWDQLNPDSSAAEGTVFPDSAAILRLGSSHDAATDYHGTHVLGIAAGSPFGPCTGMAPEAGLLGVGLNLDEKDTASVDYIPTTTLLLMGYLRIFEEAKRLGKPCVINCSIGADYGYYAGTTLFESLLHRMAGPGRIIVASAGNGGRSDVYRQFSPGQTRRSEIFYSDKELEFSTRQPADTDFKISLLFNGLATQRLTVSSAELRPALRSYGVYRTSIRTVQGDTISLEAYGNDMSACLFEVTLPDSVNQQLGGRLAYGVSGTLEVHTDQPLEFLGSPSCLAFNRTSDAGAAYFQHTTCFPSDFDDVISVGATHYRDAFVNTMGIETSATSRSPADHRLTVFSSCGPARDGRVKPDVVAPGDNVVSAFNSHCETDKSRNIVYEEDAYGRTYRLMAISGTSMSCPVVSGVVALWLQANPTLAPADVKLLLERTCHQPEPDFTGPGKNNYYGWGEIDAYAGLLAALELDTRVPTLSRHQPRQSTFSLKGRCLSVAYCATATASGSQSSASGSQPLAARPRLSVYSVSGTCVGTWRAGGAGTQPQDGGFSVDLSSLRPGVYAVQLDTADRATSGSTLIRIE